VSATSAKLAQSVSTRRSAVAAVRPRGLTKAQRERSLLPRLLPDAKLGLVREQIAETWINPETDETFEHVVDVSRRLDQLSEERTHKRITEAEYTEGRRLQVLFERLEACGSSWSDGMPRGNMVAARAHRMATLAVQSKENAAEMRALVDVIGSAGAQLLRQWLSGISFRRLAGGDVAGLVPVSERKVWSKADHVRWLLGKVTDARAAVGPSRSRGVVADRPDGWFAEGVNGPDDLPAAEVA
jgi:hypothetical protein